MAVSTFSVTDVDLTNLIIACSIPWPILVNGVPEVFINQALNMGTLEVRIPSLTSCFVLFDVILWHCALDYKTQGRIYKMNINSSKH